MNDIAARLDGIRLARTGLAVALASPTVLAIGVALVRNRDEPRRTQTLRVTPELSPTSAGVALHGRF
jgi:hypothetical protein